MARTSTAESPRVLVVDDEPAIAELVATTLRYEGFVVTTAAAGREALSAVADTLVATESSNERALSADKLATLGGRWFPRTETVEAPAEALRRARELAADGRAVLVTGSLYLLADLADRREDVPSSTDRDSASTSSPRS